MVHVREETTVGELEEAGMRLGITCLDCGRFRYVGTRRFEAAAMIADLARERTCARCQSGNIAFRPVERDASTGYWPAESA